MLPRPEDWGGDIYIVTNLNDLANPYGASNSQIGVFLDSVYSHLYGRHADAAGLAYWTNEIRATLQAGEFVGSVLTDIIGGTQAGADLWALTRSKWH